MSVQQAKITLRQIEHSDAASLSQLAATPFSKLVQFPFGLHASLEWIDLAVAAHNQSFFIICAARDEAPKTVGVCGLRQINWTARTAEIFFAMIDRDKCRATIQDHPATEDALGQLLGYGFDTLGLNRLYVEVAEHNKSLAALEKAGFVVEGIVEEAVWLDGQLRHLVCLSMLAQEFKDKNAGHHN